LRFHKNSGAYPRPLRLRGLCVYSSTLIDDQLVRKTQRSDGVLISMSWRC